MIPAPKFKRTIFWAEFVFGKHFLQRRKPLNELVRYAIRLSGTSCTLPNSSISGCWSLSARGAVRESPIGKQQFNGSIGENTCARCLISIQVERKNRAAAVFSSVKYLERGSALQEGAIRERGGRLFWLCAACACRLWVAQCLRFNNKNTRYTTAVLPLAAALLFCVFIRIPNFYECELMSGKQHSSPARLRAFIVKSGLLPGQK